MTVLLRPEMDGKVLVVHVSGRLTREDYRQFVPELEKAVEEHGKIRILFEMEDFHGWKVSALWEDVKLDFKHWNHIERIAMVGDKTWEKGMSVLCKPFTRAKIQYFEHAEMDSAREWISEGLLVTKEV